MLSKTLRYHHETLFHIRDLRQVSILGPHQYAVIWGAPNFRAELTRKQARFTTLRIDPDTNIVVTCGRTEA
jgi:hypothetical protein